MNLACCWSGLSAAHRAELVLVLLLLTSMTVTEARSPTNGNAAGMFSLLLLSMGVVASVEDSTVVRLAMGGRSSSPAALASSYNFGN